MTLKRAVGPIIGVVLLAVALWVLRHELGALLAYRVIYFFLPLLAAAVILAVREIQHRRTHVAKR
jgi:uncharacterized membrane protein YbhN (UPF0104 family)